MMIIMIIIIIIIVIAATIGGLVESLVYLVFFSAWGAASRTGTVRGPRTKDSSYY